jgi:putative restriction endonuclease
VVPIPRRATVGRGKLLAPRYWSPNIVSGKTYDSTTPVSRDLWDGVSQRLVKYAGAGQEPTKIILESGERYGREYLARARLGQGAFRVLVTDAYQRRCAITGERTLPVLEAVHIKPFAKSGPHRVSNGLLLRSDLHTLFDLGYLTIDKQLRVEISKRIREEFENGRDYYALRGKSLEVVPALPADRPSADFLEWHNEKVFVR